MNEVQKLKQIVSTIKNPESIETYFNLVHTFYTGLGLEEDTENIAQTIRTDDRMRFTVNLNARLFLGLTNQDGEDTLLATMFEKDAEKIESEVANFRKDNSKFTQIGDEEQSYIVTFSMETYQKHQADIPKWVLNCANDYLPRQEKSNLRRFHSPLLTELTFDDSALDLLLEQPEEYYFSRLIEQYKGFVREDHNRPELYKWRNVQHYQEQFDLEADDFHASLKNALSKAQNLVYQLSLSFIKKAVQYYPEEVRDMFRELYNEEKNLQERVTRFSQRADELAPQVSEAHGKELNAYQDERTVSYYLAMQYPEKYPIYKDDIYRYLLKVVTEENSKHAGEKYLHYIEIGERLLHLITGNDDLIKLVRSTLDDDCFHGDLKWLVFQDILWRTKYPPEEDTEMQQFEKAKTYLQKFSDGADEHYAKMDWLIPRFQFFRQFFEREHLKSAEWNEFRKIPQKTHAYTSLGIAGKNAFGNPNHPIERYRKSFIYLAYGEDDLATRLNKLLDKNSEYHLKYIGESFYAEVVGYIYPEEYVFYNSRDEEAIKFLNIGIERKSDEQFGDFFVRYNQEIEPLQSIYENIVGQRTNTTIPLELDQFFSWIYENFVGKETEMPEINKTEPTFWLYAPGDNAKYWDDFFQEGIMAIGWDFLGDLREYENKKEIQNSLEAHYGADVKKTNDALACWQFVNEIKTGDIIIVKKGRQSYLGYGVVTSDYDFNQQREFFYHVRNVEWIKRGEWETDFKIVVKTLTQISKYPEYVEKLAELLEINTQFSPHSKMKQYWWLNANPNIWRLADNEVGQEQTYTSHNSRGNKRQIYKNFEQVQPGDLVIGYESTPVKKVKAILEITEPLHVDDEGEEQMTFRVKQFTPNQPTWDELKSMGSLADCSVLKNNQGSLFHLTATEFDTIYDLAFKKREIFQPYIKADALKELFMLEEKLDRIRDLLEYKKNIILQGPPGTGKTFLAKRLAWLQLGAKDESRISTIQFHPSYSYEDFIRGYRPTEEHFELKDGLFLDICKQAKSDPEHPYYLVIDEINRGNLSKIFGELMMLIEKDKRGPEFKVTLPYKKQDEPHFYIPENLYLIGTMNTADRSLALVDYALRRRFVFIDLMPNFGEKFQRHLKSLGVDEGTITLIVERLESLNAEITEESGLGKGFQIGHSYFCQPKGNDTQWYRNIIEYEIIPLLNEYWFDKPEKVKSLKDDLLSI